MQTYRVYDIVSTIRSMGLNTMIKNLTGFFLAALAATLLSTTALAEDAATTTAVPTVGGSSTPVGYTSTGAGNGITAQMAGGQSINLPSNSDLARAAGLEGEAAEIFTVPDGDQSFKYLVKIFGTSLYGLGDAQPSMIQGVMSTWSIAVMVIGLAFLSYILLSGVLKTAHEGEVLGRQWSSIWIPLRAATGFAMILPVAGGYCMAQVLVAWLTTLGIGVADGIWNSVGHELQMTHGGIVRPDYPDAKFNVEKIFVYQVCNQSLQKSAGEQNYKAAVQYIDGTLSDGLVFGNESGSGYAKDACGGFNWNVVDNLTTDASSQTAGGIVQNGIKLDALFDENKNLTKKIYDAQRAAIIRTANYFEPFAKHIVETKTIPEGDFLGGALAEYNRTMDTYYQGVTGPYLDKKIEQVNQDMTKDGWLFAGAYFMRFVNLNNELRDLAQAQPSDIASNTISIDGIVAEPVVEDMNLISEFLQDREQKQGNLGVAEGFKREAGLDSGGKFDQALARTMHGGLMAQDEFVQMMAVKDKHPIITLQNMGNYMIGAYEAAKLVEFGLTKVVPAGRIGSALSAKGGATGAKSQAAGVAADTVKGTMDWLFDVLLVAALILAIGVPLLPYIIWCIDVLGWLVAIVVSVIAAPIWMVMHMHPEGHEVAGYGAQGYMLLLSVVLKPALMVISLIFAMLLSWAAIDITATGWSYAFASANSNVIVGPVISIGGMVVFSMLMLLLVYKTFALIHGIQNEVLSWVGGRDQDLVGAGRSAEAMAGMMAAAAVKTGGLSGKIAGRRDRRADESQIKQGNDTSRAADDHDKNWN